MNEVFGVFYLYLAEGNYSGEFFNNHLNSFRDENIVPNPGTQGYIGTFQTNWMESGKMHTADLKITFENNIYSLLWSNVQIEGEIQQVTFSGRGILENDRLVCVYKMNSPLQK